MPAHFISETWGGFNFLLLLYGQSVNIISLYTKKTGKGFPERDEDHGIRLH